MQKYIVIKGKNEMIFDNISSIEKYKNDNKLYKELKKLTLLKIGDKDEEKRVATVKFDEAKFENHLKNIDIHYVVSGKEKILVSNSIDNLVRLTEYDCDNDYELFDISRDFSSVVLFPGDFLVVYPGEAHAPKISDDGEDVYKTVVKLKY